MRTLAILNQKGGVGKTTTAVNVSAALAEAGSRVTLIDLDPQAHASLHLGVSASGVAFESDTPDHTPSIYEVLAGDATLTEARHAINDRLSLVASHLDLAAAEIELATEPNRERVLRRRIADADWHESEPDYLLIDCPPSLGLLTLNALAAVDEVIIPLQPHFLALHGLGKLLETIQAVARGINPSLRLNGVVLCMYDGSTRLASEVSQDVEEFLNRGRDQATPWSAARLYSARISRNIRLAEAPSYGQSIFDYASSSKGAADYRQLARELMEQESPRSDIVRNVAPDMAEAVY